MFIKLNIKSLMNDKKLALVTDFYELTMSNSYFIDNRKDEIAVFDMFFRKIPDQGGYAVFAGLEQVVRYILNLKFNSKEIKYLESKKLFDPKFIEYLKTFKFSGDIYSMIEGTPIFPNEPILVVKAPLIECQLIETMILLSINHQSLIATKSSRIIRAAKGRAVLEFGARRAHGYNAATLGARAAYIAGVIGTSNTFADYLFKIPALGTMAHSFVQSYETEYEAFKAYAKNYPDNTVLLIDTYDTLKSGILNAVKVNNEILKPLGKELKGVRIDSGDLAYLSKKVRSILDENGLQNTKITVSNSLDEFLITDLISNQNAPIDVFGVGERLITARSEAVFGGVYKLSALYKNNKETPKIKLSENSSKTTIPGFKQVYRFYDQDNMAIADVITLFDELIDESKDYLLFDPIYPYKQKVVKNFKCKKLLEPIIINGKLVYKLPKIKDIRRHYQTELKTLWNEVLRLNSPHLYYVDLSQKLYDLKQELISNYRKK